MATLLFVHAVHEISNVTFYKLLENRQPVYFQATCRMYHVIFPCTACKNNNVAVSLVTKVALCMVNFCCVCVYTCTLMLCVFAGISVAYKVIKPQQSSQTYTKTSKIDTLTNLLLHSLFNKITINSSLLCLIIIINTKLKC